MSYKYTRIAIVTGTTSGIGEATARKFIAAGFGVVGAYMEGLSSGTNVNRGLWPSTNPEFANMDIINQDTLVEIADLVLPQAVFALTGIPPQITAGISTVGSIFYDGAGLFDAVPNVVSLGVDNGRPTPLTIIIFPPAIE